MKAMSNCHPDTARLGWEIYRNSVSTPSLEVINQELQESANESISDRMYRHYRRLAYHGCTEYLPINELDVLIKIQRLTAQS